MKADTRSSKLKETINRPKAGININTVLTELGNVSRRDVSIVGEETKTYSQRHFEKETFMVIETQKRRERQKEKYRDSD